MKNKQTFYFSDKYDEDFFGDSIDNKVIDKNYKYTNNNLFYQIASFLYYYMIFLPIAFVYCKIVRCIKYKNKSVLKQAKNTSYIAYGNHTHNLSDAFSPSMLFRKKPNIIVNSKNLNIPFLKSSTKMLGALPLPTRIDATKNFLTALKNLTEKKKAIIIYPEAHLWPYYTQIRPFKSASFKYLIMFDVPAFCFTTTYQATKRKNKYKTVIYVDGPFYVNKDLDDALQKEDLKNRIFQTMQERSKNSNFEKNIYKRKEENL